MARSRGTIERTEVPEAHQEEHVPSRVLESKVLDYGRWGALWRGARYNARMSEAVLRAELAEAGIDMSKRTLLSVERGERPLSDEELIAFMQILRPPFLFAYFGDAVKDPYSEVWPHRQ
jgi:hypothetical protein